jgi:hypothetical protein
MMEAIYVHEELLDTIESVVIDPKSEKYSRKLEERAHPLCQ